ncbi:hypothetical protein STANM309S_05701 [Streptomyces tanashiensis]
MSSRAKAYAARSSPPWKRRSQTVSPATPLRPTPGAPGASIRTGPSTGRLSMPVIPEAASVYSTDLARPTFTLSKVMPALYGRRSQRRSRESGCFAQESLMLDA